MLAVSCGSEEISEGFACTVGGYLRFDPVYLEGPELTRDEFAETPEGNILNAEFVGGPAEVESGPYGELTGFSIASGSLVLGYRNGVPIQSYELENGRLRSWGGCQPTAVSGDLVAARLEVARSNDPESSSLAIDVEGGGCSVDGGNVVSTDIVSANVVEDALTVRLIVWTRETFEGEFCAGVGLTLPFDIPLDGPLGDRSVVNNGVVPAVTVWPVGPGR